MKPKKKTDKRTGQTYWLVDVRTNGNRSRQRYSSEQFALEAIEKQNNSNGEIMSEISALSMTDQGMLLGAFQLAKEKGLNLYDLARENETSSHLSTTKVSAVIAAYLTARVEDPDLKTVGSTLNGYVNDLAKFEITFGDTEIGSLTEDGVVAYLKTLKMPDGSPYATSSRTNKKRILNTFFVWAKRNKYITQNPLAEYTPSKGDKADITWLNASQMKRLLQVCMEIDPGMIPYFTLGAFGGLRLNEYRGTADTSAKGTPGVDGYIPLMKGKVGINWDDHVHLDKAHPQIEIPKEIAKTSQRRIVTLEPTLVKWLRMGGDLYAITNWKTRELKIRRKAKLEGLGRWGWGRDIMRHTYATMHVAKFEAEHKASKNMGHNDIKVFRTHYCNKEVDPSEAERFWELTPANVN
mgnify:FL=1